jgi:Holliday junction resolvase RusA-like endonuclease
VDNQHAALVTDQTDPQVSIPFPVEFLIRETARSQQAKGGNQAWKTLIKSVAQSHLHSIRELAYIDARPLAVTIFYFPGRPMPGDVDNIVKPILDGMVGVFYLDDRVIERVVVQKFELGYDATFVSPTRTLEDATLANPPVIYIRIEDGLAWRAVV